MAVKNEYNRQSPKYAVADLGPAQMGAGNEVTFKIPRGALVVGVGVYTETAFNSATTATATVADGTTTFVAAQDIKTAGAETVAVPTKFYPNGGTITVSLAQTGAAATAGRAVAHVGYVQLGAMDTIQE